MENVIIGIDCGKKGAICILEEGKIPTIYEMPLISEKNKAKKIKTNYDLKEIVSYFSNFKDRNVIYTLERQSLRLGEGAVSAMTIGEGIGSLKGIGYALGFNVNIVSPQTWKKQFPSLQSNEFIQMKIEQKSINASARELIKLAKKDKTKKKEYLDRSKELKKEADKLGRDIKAEAKTQARLLAAKLCPELADRFKLIKNDGPAESLLIAYYAKDNLPNDVIVEEED